MDRYAVVGNPIAHSKSPIIQAMFAEQTGEQLQYDKMLVAEGAFAEDVSAFFALGGRGLNVTVPFKEEAYTYADQLTERGRVAQAINTLALQSDGSVLGDNTDGAGFMADLKRLNWNIANKTVLVLGAGGAARGLLHPLLQGAPARLVVANRTSVKAEDLARSFASYGEISGCGYDAVARQVFDLIINATSTSLTGELPAVSPTIFGPQSCAYDLMYGSEPTVFLRWAQEENVRDTADGLGMLVGQAAEAFHLWRGKFPEITPVLESLRNVKMV